MTLRPLLALSIVILAACTPAVTPMDNAEVSVSSTGPGELYPAYVSENGVLTIPPLGLRITDNVPLFTEPTFGPDFPITNSGAQTWYGVRLSPYDEPSDGIGDWIIPSVIGKQLQTDQACVILGQAGTGVYLPVKTDRLMQCGVFTNNDGQRVIAAVGYSDTFESPDHLGSMLIIPREDDAIVMDHLVAFPEFDAWLEVEAKAFERAHPNDYLWPPTTPAAEEFYVNATNEVGRNIGQPSEEVAKNMNELEAWTKRVSTY
jgi:hypothetical protein